MKRFISLLNIVLAVSLIVAGCAPPTPQVIEKEVVVEKEVPVTIEKEAVVEKEVEEITIRVLDAVNAIQGSLRLLPGVSDDTKSLLLDALSNAVASLERSDGEGTIEALERFASLVEEHREEIDNSVSIWPEIEGASTVSEWLLSFAEAAVLLGPSDILTTSTTISASRRACIRKCLEDLALCLGITAGAIMTCGLGCLPTLLLGPQAYLGCVGVCVALAGGTLSAICAKQFLDCVKACP